MQRTNMNDDDAYSSQDEDESMQNDKSFAITERVSTVSDYQDIYDKVHAKKKPKQVSTNILQDLPEQEYATMKIKFVKPFDYGELRSKEKRRGVIFLQKPDFNRTEDTKFQNQSAVRAFFSEFGTVTRVQSCVEGSRIKRVTGYHVEYDDKNIAKRVALTLNGNSISAKDSRVLTIKYVPHFTWAEHSESM